MRRSTKIRIIVLSLAGLTMLGGYARSTRTMSLKAERREYLNFRLQSMAAMLEENESQADADTATGETYSAQEARNDLETANEYLDLSEESDNSRPVDGAITWSHACDAGKKVTLVAVGDVLLHQPLAEQGLKDKNGFRSLWAPLEHYFTGGDFAYANLEGPTAGNVSSGGSICRDPGRRFDHAAYTGYPQFNYHPSLPGDLKASGFDIVSTANNHAMDRRSIGVDRTIEALRDADLAFSGTTSSSELDDRHYSTVTTENGMKIAWIACTFSTNGLPDPKNQVLSCFEERSTVLAEIRKRKADRSIDAVIVTPHWGIEYNIFPGGDQRNLAKEMIDAGALIVFGSHPHVLQPVEKITASDGREGFVIYSLGNFVSNQKTKLTTKTAAALFVGLTKDAKGNVYINGVRHLPTVMAYEDKIAVHPAWGRSSESRQLANRILKGSVELTPSEAVVTNPQCQ